MGKTALIVDDSKSARFVLKRMLEAHSLQVDTVESAELALDYLNDNRPDVIFMDHMMPGMDGFEAVTAIKKNPATATIPIMMYTSQKGEVYVGQARALGAVGVLPKEVEPVEVSKVLASLRVIGEADGSAKFVAERRATDNSRDLDFLDKNMRLLIEDLFDQQRAILRADIEDSYRNIADRLADEIRPRQVIDMPRSGQAVEHATATSRTADSSDSWPQLARDGNAGAEEISRWRVAIVFSAAVSLLLAIALWNRQQTLEAAIQTRDEIRNELDARILEQEQGSASVQRRLENYQLSLESAYASTLRALEWGINQTGRYEYAEFPLDDSRLSDFDSLLRQLIDVGFVGVVRIETHAGDFCLLRSPVEGYVLASGDIAANNCDRIGQGMAAALEAGQQRSIAFVNLMNTTELQTAGQIRFQIVSVGNAAPLIDYPLMDDTLLASQWNRVAAANNRIQVRLVAD